MRYYDIQIYNTDGSKYGQYTSLLPDGNTNAAALNVEIDVTLAFYHQPAGDSMVRIWGPDLKDFSNARQFNGKKIKVFAGMQKGLPLANPKQAGLLIEGQIFQSFGNWIDTDMTLTFILIPPTGTVTKPLNFSFNWQAGTSLANSIGNVLSTAFPGIKQNIQIKSNLVLPQNQWGVYSTLSEFSKTVYRISKSIVTDPKYLGVSISYDGNVINVLDQANPKKQVNNIQLSDLIGQPMWIAPLEVQARFVMRSDIGLTELLKLPPTPVTTQAAALTQFNDQLTFSGDFTTTFIRHVGNFREPDGNAWSTTVNMFPNPATTT